MHYNVFWPLVAVRETQHKRAWKWLKNNWMSNELPPCNLEKKSIFTENK
jgi:hypothetical protein